MRADPSQGEAFGSNEAWEKADLTVFTIRRSKPEDGEGLPFRSIPFSGRERNRLFINDGDNFSEHTLVSGADFREDGRGFALFDYDSDGFLDLAVSSPNTPKLRIARNRMGDISQDVAKNSFVRLKLVGGHDSTEQTTEWSPRDPFGATVVVTTGEMKRIFQLSCSEGLGAQNSRALHIGMAEFNKIDELTVNWPSGKSTTVKNVDSGKTLTVYENEAMKP